VEAELEKTKKNLEDMKTKVETEQRGEIERLKMIVAQTVLRADDLPDSAFSSSSEWRWDHSTSNCRLHCTKLVSSWCAKTNQVGEWIMVDLGKVCLVFAVLTQGRGSWDLGQWVTRYSLQHSNDRYYFADIGTFSGNSDSNTVVRHDFFTSKVSICSIVC